MNGSSRTVNDSQRRSAPRSIFLTGIAVALLLAACGQNATPTAPAVGAPSNQGAGGSTPTVPGTSEAQLISLDATSSTSLHLMFSGAVGVGSAEARSYRLTEAGGAALEVLAAYVSADGLSVDLATRPQEAKSYSLTLAGVQSKAGQAMAGTKTFNGSQLAAPVLSDVVPLSATEVLLSFGNPLTGQFSALSSSATLASAYAFSGGVEVRSVRLSQDKGSVVVTTSGLSAESYTVSALNVQATPDGSKLGVLIDPQHNQASFTALAVTDTVKPVLKRITTLGANKVQLIFSEPVKPDAADLSKYLIKDQAGAVLAVSEASLSEFRTSVTLTTTPQAAGTSYTLTAPELQDAAGNALDPASTLKFSGYAGLDAGRADTTPPRVSGAASTATNSVLVTFSEGVRGGSGSAENVTHYRITGLETLGANGQVSPAASGTVTPQTASLDIVSAVLQPNGTSVLLTTRAQSDIRYELHVTGVTDLAGNQIAPPERDLDPGKAVFVGTPVSGAGVDTDHDGLPDAVEQRGWQVTVTGINGKTRTYEVTSDPMLADTDGDGFSDLDEKTNLTDPRLADTDGDQIDDAREYNVVYSSPVNADTDGDTLSDGSEANFYASSPLLADTDGDGIRDDVEALSPLRNALIADLPTPELSVSGVDLKLDVRFTATRGSSSRQLDSKSVQTTLSQSRANAEDYSTARTSEWFSKAGVSVTAGFNGGGSATNVGFPSYSIAGTVSTETGGGGSTTMNFTRSSVEQSQQEYSSSLSSDREVSYDETVTRETPAAQFSAGVSIKSGSSIAFTVRNLEVTAYLTDPYSPGRLVPVATLKAEGDSGVNGISVGPSSPVRGPLRFTSVQAYPSEVEQLLQNPENLVFKITNYDLTDELGRNFAYTSQQVKERTAEINIDYGGLQPAEHYNVATSSDFGPDGKQIGVSLPDILENILKLKHVDHSSDATLPAAELQNSYSTATIQGGEVLTRIRSTYIHDGVNYLQSWFINKNNTNQNNRPVTALNIHAGDVLDLMFTQDQDKDGMVKSVEDLYGSSDTSRDSDSDGVNDPTEAFGPLDNSGERHPLTITYPGGRVQPLLSSPARPDTDFDGIWDENEYALRTDPSNPDTDGDGVYDGAEIDGSVSRDYFTKLPVKRFSDPLKADTDGDTLTDGVELRIGTDPKVQDFEKVADDDHDGLSNLQEKTGWSYFIRGEVPQVEHHVVSNPQLADTDGDGVSDKDEFVALTDPTNPDTDKDGLSDREEIADFKTDPKSADTDGDLRSDYDEVKKPWVPRVLGVTTPVYSSPLLADTDYDGLSDKEEWNRWMDPTKVDTDGDGASDYYEVKVAPTLAGGGVESDPLRKNKVVNVRLTSVKVDGSCDGAGDNYIELRGQFNVASNSEAARILNFAGGGADGPDDVKAGGYWTPYSEASHTYNLFADDALRVYTTNLLDKDPAGNPDDRLEDFSDSYKYDEIASGTFSKSVVGVADSDKTDCGVTFNYAVKWFK